MLELALFLCGLTTGGFLTAWIMALSVLLGRTNKADRPQG